MATLKRDEANYHSKSGASLEAKLASYKIGEALEYADLVKLCNACECEFAGAIPDTTHCPACGNAQKG